MFHDVNNFNSKRNIYFLIIINETIFKKIFRLKLISNSTIYKKNYLIILIVINIRFEILSKH